MADLFRPEAGAPITAEDAEHRGFATSFRGFDPAEVRAYLRRVAETIRALQDEQRRLETRAREAERRAEHPTLDESTLAAALGDETARILRSAHEAAAEIRGKAEAHVEAIAQQARDEGTRLTAEAANILEVRRAAAEAEAEQITRGAAEEAERMRSEARAEAEQVLADAATRAEDAVEEARQQRAAVLSDLRRRRRVANTQIEQLRAGRERLIAAYEVVGRTLGEVSDELQRADVEARAAADDVGRRLTAAVDPELVDALASPADFVVPTAGSSSAAGAATDDTVADATGSEPVAADAPAPDPTNAKEAAAPSDDNNAPTSPTLITTTPRAAPAPQGRPHRRKGRGGRPPAAQPSVSPERTLKESRVTSPRPTVSPQPSSPVAAAPFDTELSAAEAPVSAEALATPDVMAAESGEPTAAPEPSAAPDPSAAPEPSADATPAANGADDLFARLRAEREAAVSAAEEVLADDLGAGGAPVDSAAAPAPDRRLFVARDEACEPLEAHLSRRIKRALQDEQNLALDRLRSVRGTASVETALGGEAEQLAGYIAIVQPALTDAAAAGAEASGANALAARAAVDAVAADLAAEIVLPLRRRLDERLHEAAAVGDDRATITDRVGAAYRELKAQRVSRLASDWLAVAWARGAYGSPGEGSGRVWTVDPERPCCTDCDDNALAGVTTAGEPFPTGHLHPPAHPGCRCVLVSPTA